MTKVYHINKSRLYADVNYTAVLNENRLNGYALRRVSHESITVSKGEVCFFDPYNTGDDKPFAVSFPEGEYKPFMLTVSTSKGLRVAYAGLDGGELNKSVQWRLALKNERDVLKLLSPDENVGTFINSGFGALCDTDTFNRFVKLVKDGEDAFHPLDGVVNMDGSCAQLCKIKDVKLPVFNTGWGEGNYVSYIGVGADGKINGLICDFAMIESEPIKDDGETVEFEFETDGEEPYEYDKKKSDFENGIAQYSAIIAKGDENAAEMFNAYSRRGYSYHKAGKTDEALADYLKAIEIGKKNPAQTGFTVHAWSLYDNAALIYRDSGKTDEAIKLYEDARGISDTFYSGAYAGLIDIYRDNKNYAKALEVADEMVAVRPHDPSAYLKRCEIYMACEEYEKAILDIDILINDYKLNESILDKALCLCFLGRNKEALEVIDTYLLEGRASEVYYDVRAAINMADNNFAAAYIDARKAFDVNPDYLATLEKLIDMDSLFLNFKNVIKWATRYIELRPRYEYGYSVRADAYMRIGEYDSATADYVYLVHNIKDSAKYYDLLIKAALGNGDGSLAKKYYKKLKKLDNAYYIHSAGLFLLKEKKYARAERYLMSAFALKEDDVILSSLIDCFIESGNIEKAEAAMNKFSTIADGEEAFEKYARIAKFYGASVESVEKDYIKKYLGDCRDSVLLEKVKAFFGNIGNK